MNTTDIRLKQKNAFTNRKSDDEIIDELVELELLKEVIKPQLQYNRFINHYTIILKGKYSNWEYTVDKERYEFLKKYMKHTIINNFDEIIKDKSGKKHFYRRLKSGRLKRI